MRKKVLVTGAAGFIGAALVKRLLTDGYEVYALVKKNTDLWRIQPLINSPHLTVLTTDLRYRSSVAKVISTVQPNIVYHLATRGAYPSQTQMRDLLFSNIVGTWNLIDALLKFPCELFVQTGSSSEYGFVSEPMRESFQSIPNSLYSVTKQANTALAQYLGTYTQFPSVTARLFSVYGEGEEKTRLFPTLVDSLQHQKVLKMADPRTARDYIFLDDVLDFFLNTRELQKFPGGVFNVGTGVQTTLKEVVTQLEKVSAKKMLVDWNAYPSRDWDSSNWVADMKHTFSKLSWRPKHTVADGLSKLLDIASSR